MPELAFITIILTIAIIFAASILKGVTGFGFALFSVPLLSFIFPMSTIVPALALFNVVTSSSILFGLKQKVRWYYIVPMFVASLGGIPLGIYALEYMNEETLKLIVGMMVIIFSLKLLKGVNMAKRFKKMPLFFAGFLSGVLTSSISIGGPPLVIAMYRKGYNKDFFKAVFSWFTVFSSSFASVAFYIKGFLTPESIKFAALALPLLVLGSGWGNKIARKIHQEQFRKLIIYVNVITGLIIIVTTLLAK